MVFHTRVNPRSPSGLFSFGLLGKADAALACGQKSGEVQPSPTFYEHASAKNSKLSVAIWTSENESPPPVRVSKALIVLGNWV